MSFKIREALRQALPAPVEQFFTVMVPGKVVNFDDYEQISGTGNNIITPLQTQLSEAILCDDMPALAPVQLGPTGKSVTRSYSAAISKLVPAGSTICVDLSDLNHVPDPEEERYKTAMRFLTHKNEKDSKTRVEIYAEKQAAYTKVVEAKVKAFDDALQRAKDDPRSISKADKRATYDAWVNEHARTYRNLTQGAYMDWVVNGLKEEVEYWFSVVDRDTAMARVEASKQAMRDAVVQDTDGSAEYHTVKLTPSNWAVLAKQKAAGGKNQTRTAEWYSWEISRLRTMNAMLDGLSTETSVDKVTREPVTLTASEDKVKEKSKEFIKFRHEYAIAAAKKDANQADKDEAYKKYNDSRAALREAEDNLQKDNIKKVNSDISATQKDMYAKLKVASTGLIATTIAGNTAKITDYETKIKLLGTGEDGVLQQIGQDAGLPKALPDPEAVTSANPNEDYFTVIVVELSSAKSSSTSSAMAESASASHDSLSSKMASSMAKNSCKISFECMRVDIARSWLRPELFYDADLTVGHKEHISPGFNKLRDLMQSTDRSAEEELQRYSTFPMYPTSFLLAANVELEFTGETSDIQSEFQHSSTSGGGSLGFGPFSIFHASTHASKTTESSSSSCEATADGCRITIKSPQIIGWVSEMVPALPRLKSMRAPA